MVSSETKGTFFSDTTFPVKEEAHLLMFALNLWKMAHSRMTQGFDLAGCSGKG